MTDNLFVLTHPGTNIVFRLVEEKNILKPEKVLRLLYAQPLKGITNKRYIIINHWSRIDSDFYAEKLSVVLKVRAMENYCAVLLTLDNLTILLIFCTVEGYYIQKGEMYQFSENNKI